MYSRYEIEKAKVGWIAVEIAPGGQKFYGHGDSPQEALENIGVSRKLYLQELLEEG